MFCCITRNDKFIVTSNENLFHIFQNCIFVYEKSDEELKEVIKLKYVTGREPKIILLGRGFEKLCDLYSQNRETVFYSTDPTQVLEMQKKHPLMLIGFYFRHEYGMPYPNDKSVFYHETEKGNERYELSLKVINECLFAYCEWDMRHPSMTDLVKFLNKPEQPFGWTTRYSDFEIKGQNDHAIVYFYKKGHLQYYENWSTRFYHVSHVLFKDFWMESRVRVDNVAWRAPYWFFTVGAKKYRKEEWVECCEIVCAKEDFSDYFLRR